MESFVGFLNYSYFLSDPAFFAALTNTLLLVLGVLIITVVGGIAFALLLDQDIYGQGIVRILVIAPFFVMPTVAALVWKNMFMNPVNGLFAHLAKALGLQPYDWLANAPLFSIILIVAWQWLPFATLILLTSSAVAGRGAEGSCRNGWRRRDIEIHLYHSAAYGARHHGGDPDPDDLPAFGLCRNPGYHQRRPGHAEHEPDLPRLCAGASSSSISAALRRAVSLRSSSPTSSRSSLSALSARIWRLEMARKVTTQRKVITTAIAWTLAILIFFPILLDVSDELQVGGRRDCFATAVPVLPLDDGKLRRGAEPARTISATS